MLQANDIFVLEVEASTRGPYACLLLNVNLTNVQCMYY